MVSPRPLAHPFSRPCPLRHTQPQNTDGLLTPVQSFSESPRVHALGWRDSWLQTVTLDGAPPCSRRVTGGAIGWQGEWEVPAAGMEPSVQPLFPRRWSRHFPGTAVEVLGRKGSGRASLTPDAGKGLRVGQSGWRGGSGPAG